MHNTILINLLSGGVIFLAVIVGLLFLGVPMMILEFQAQLKQSLGGKLDEDWDEARVIRVRLAGILILLFALTGIMFRMNMQSGIDLLIYGISP